MPQFDIYSYSGQVFFTLIFFVFFYLIVSKVLLPKLARTDKFRRKLLELAKNKKEKPTFYVDAISSLMTYILKNK